MAEASGVVGALTDPYTASYGERWERIAASLFVGTVAGVTTAMAMYVYRFPEISYDWAAGPALLLVVFGLGVLVKLLVGELRASVTAIILAVFLGAGLHVAVEILPFYLLGISTRGVVLYVPLRNVFTFLVLFQIPLQFAGYLAAVTYEGLFGG